MKVQISALLFLLFVSFPFAKSDAVCDLELLLLELKQDMDDNGILDCLRIIQPPSGVVETPEQINKRLAAQWDSSCSFESSLDWFTPLKNTFEVTSLVDEIGEKVEQNIPEQADMCEIVRALIAAGKFGGITSDLTNLKLELLTAIDCPGEENGPKICAVNGISIYKKDMWTILLGSSVITVNEKPLFIKSSDNKSRFDQDSIQQEDPGMPIEREDIRAAKRISMDANGELEKLISSEKDFTKQDTTRPAIVEKRVSVWFSSFKQENIIPNKGWAEFNSGTLELKMYYNSFILSYNMLSGYSQNTRIATRLLYDEVNQISSRMMTGMSHNPSATSGFITETQIGSHLVKTQYRTNSSFSLDVNNKDTENISTGTVIIPYVDLRFKKIINPDEVQLFNNNNFGDFPNLSTTFKLNKSSNVLIMYSVSMPGMQSHIVTHLEINSTLLFQSRSICGDSAYWSIHNTSVVKLMADVDYRVKVKYRTPYSARTNPRMNDWESQSLTILQLPDWFNMQVVDIEEEFVLNCDNKWTMFPKMDIDLELEDDKAILFMYNVVLPLVDKKISVGLFVNDILDKRSVVTLSKQMYFKAFGYYPISFDKGKYKIHLKYLSEACVTYKPRTDWQGISLTILDMN